MFSSILHLLPSVLPLHFKKNLATANGLSISGSALGAFVYPPFYEYILNTYEMSGSFLILSAFALNTLPAAMLLTYSQHRLETSQRKKTNNNRFEENHATVSTIPSETASQTKEAPVCSKLYFKADMNSHVDSCDRNATLCKKQPQFDTSNNTIDVLMPNHPHVFNEVEERTCENKSYGNSEETISSENTNGLSKTISRSLPDTLDAKHISTYETTKDCPYKSFNKIEEVNTISRVVSDYKLTSERSSMRPMVASSSLPELVPQQSLLQKAFSLLFDPIYFSITFTQSCLLAIISLLNTVIVDYAFDKGISMSLSVYLLMSSAIFDLIGRLSLGSVTDGGYMSSERFSALCYFCVGVCTMGIALSSEFFGILASICIFTFCTGGQMLISPVIVSKYFSGEKRIIAMACRNFFYIPMSFAISPLIGLFRDGLGSYEWLFYFMTIFSVGSSTLLLFLPNIAKLGKNNQSFTS